MGSEMCIRDRRCRRAARRSAGRRRLPAEAVHDGRADDESPGRACLLYTSDAADERSSVDLGGRRIIKKKKYTNTKIGDSCAKVVQAGSIAMKSK